MILMGLSLTWSITALNALFTAECCSDIAHFSEWLQEFVNDQDVKIVVISSIGAFHRQLALKGSMPLNLPSGLSDNILDGLFTSGLRLLSSFALSLSVHS